MTNVTGCSLFIKVTPRSHKDICTSFEDNVLKIRLRAAPSDGEANNALIEFLSHLLNVPKTTIFIRKGKTSRLKEVFIQDLSLQECRKKINIPSS